jgi:LacI family transcriptional regulator
MQAVADLAGVHRTTVSLCLNDHPRIPDKTRARVRAAAQKLGYQINPLVSALMHAKRTMKPPANLSTLGWITAWPTRYGWRSPENPIPDFFPGAAACAGRLGYKLEHFWLAEPGMTPRRMSHILRARGIQGVILGRLPPGIRKVDLDWPRFATVAIGVSLESPRLSHVASNHFYSCKLAYQTCATRGYQRIGLALPQKLYERVHEKLLGAYLAEQMNYPRKQWLPPLVSAVPNERAFWQWMKHRPDVILCPDVDLIQGWLVRGGWKVPRDVGVVGVAVEKADGRQAGVWADPAIVGAMATELVVSLLHRNQRGLPAHDQEILYRGDWVEGETLLRTAAR